MATRNAHKTVVEWLSRSGGTWDRQIPQQPSRVPRRNTDTLQDRKSSSPHQARISTRWGDPYAASAIVSFFNGTKQIPTSTGMRIPKASQPSINLPLPQNHSLASLA